MPITEHSPQLFGAVLAADRSLQNRSFFARKSAKLFESGASKKGLAFSSSDIADGTLGCPAERSCSTFATNVWRAALSGSTERAKRALLSVYSCPQQTLVSPGKSASLRRLLYISSAVPSIKRPQPKLNRVSPDSRISPSGKKKLI